MNDERMQPYVCISCGYIYDPTKGNPERGFHPPVPFAELPDDWTCPMCYSPKTAFDPL
jgi:rubredoxin